MPYCTGSEPTIPTKGKTGASHNLSLQKIFWAKENKSNDTVPSEYKRELQRTPAFPRVEDEDDAKKLSPKEGLYPN